MKIKWLKRVVWIANLVILIILLIFFVKVFFQPSEQNEIPENRISESELGSETSKLLPEAASLEDYSLIWKRFAPETPPAEPEAPPLKLELLELKLKGTIMEKDRALAIISDHKRKERLLKVGDEIEGASVLEVTPTKVILGYLGHRVALYLKPDEEGKRAEVLPAEAR